MTEQIDSIANNSELENLKKKVSDLESELGKKNNEIGEYSKFQNEVSPALQLIANNPELRDKFRETWGKVYGNPMAPGSQEPGQQPKKETKETPSKDLPDERIKGVDEKLNKVEKSQRERVIRDFEDRYGISNLSDDKKKEVRREIESYLNTFGQSVQTAPIETLDTVLEKAHKAAGAEKAIKEGNFESYARDYTNYSGALPHMNSRQLEPETQETLDAKQKGWAEKFGVDPKKAEEVYKNRDFERIRPTKAEKKS